MSLVVKSVVNLKKRFYVYFELYLQIKLVLLLRIPMHQQHPQNQIGMAATLSPLIQPMSIDKTLKRAA